MLLGFLGLSVNWWLIILFAALVVFIVIYVNRNKIRNYINKRRVSKGSNVKLGVSGSKSSYDVNKGQPEQIWKRLEEYENRLDAMINIQNKTDENISKLSAKINKK